MKTSACLLLVLLLMSVVLAQDTRHEPKGNLFPGPGQGADGLKWVNEMESWSADPKADFPYWLHDLKVWRHERLTAWDMTTPSIAARNCSGRSVILSSRR